MIIRNSDNVVLYDNNWTLTDTHVYNSIKNIRDGRVNSSNASVVKSQLPDNFKGGCFTYSDGVFGVTDRGLVHLQAVKLKKLSEDFAVKTVRPIVDSGLGFDVHGGYTDIIDFEQSQHLGANTFIVATDNKTYPVTPEEFDSVLNTMRANGLSLKQRKWVKRDEINDATIDTIQSIDPTDW